MQSLLEEEVSNFGQYNKVRSTFRLKRTRGRVGLKQFLFRWVMRPKEIQSNISSRNQVRWHSWALVGMTLTESVRVRELKFNLETGLVNERPLLHFEIITFLA